MRWKRGASRDVIDARGGGGGRRRMGVPAAGGGLGLVGVLIFLAIQVLGGGGAFEVPQGFDGDVQARDGRPIPADQDPERDLKEFTGYVFTNAQDRWEQVFSAQGRRYERAELVLYRDAVSSGCGNASSAVGPFYCPTDKRVYIDLSFFADMDRRLRAPGDFAWAYVIAHEVGHHVQKVLGTSDRVRRLQRSEPDRANELSVRLELQADCYAGVWAQSVYEAGALEDGDLEEAFTASEAVGDDRLQRDAGRTVDPDSFTHGSSAQRRDWFRRGEQGGEPAACDTFSTDDV